MASQTITACCTCGGSHESLMHDAKCTYDFYMAKPNWTHDQGIAVIQIVYGLQIAKEIDRYVHARMSQFFT